jgi:hypothetical protein
MAYYINLKTMPNSIRVIKSRKMRWAGRAAQKGEMKNMYKILVRKPEGKRPSGKLKCRWGDIRMDLGKYGEVWTGFIWFRIRTNGGLL